MPELQEYRLPLAGREWSITHNGLMLTPAEEVEYFESRMSEVPYGLVLWPASIALAYELAARGNVFAGKSLLELGAGTGLPGLIAASLGAHVTQTDRPDSTLALCRANAERNGVAGIEYVEANWAEWSDARRYDWIIGSDILYAVAMHSHLTRIFETNLAPGGCILCSDPLRSGSLRLLEALERTGWTVSMTRWQIAQGEIGERTVAIYELGRED